MNIEGYATEITSANILNVEVGTNCPKGGDSGHGGRTILKIQNIAATDWDIQAKYDDCLESIEIVLGGDTECETFIEALEFAAKTLKKQMQLNSIKAYLPQPCTIERNVRTIND